MERRARTAIALLTLPVVALAACGDDDDDEDGSAGTTAATATTAPTTGGTAAAGGVTSADLDGRTFVSTSVTGYELVEGTVVSMGFEGDALGAVAGCNTIRGGYEIDGDVLVMGTAASTLMACESDLQAQDEWLVGFLTAGPTVSLDGDDLTLATADVTVELVDEAADPAASLDGAAWTIVSIDTADGSASAPDGASIAGEDGRVLISTGCNSGSTTAEIADGQVTFGPIALTRMACEPDRAEFETALLLALEGPLVYEAMADGATLTAEDGTTIVLEPLP